MNGPFWLGGLGLAAVALLHWWLLRRLLSVSGRVTTLVDSIAERESPTAPEMTEAELIEALRAATSAEFGSAALGATAPQPAPTPAQEAQSRAEPIVFFGSILVGACAAAWLSGRWALSRALAGAAFDRLTHGHGVWQLLFALAGGMLVGFGTRMAGGCSSGHGLCGVSQLKRTSAAATATFFVAAAATAWAMEALAR